MMISRVLQARILSAGARTPYLSVSYLPWGQPWPQAQLWARPREIWQGERGKCFHVSPRTFKAEPSGGSHCLGSFSLQSPAWRCKNWRCVGIILKISCLTSAASVLTILGWQGSNYALKGVGRLQVVFYGLKNRKWVEILCLYWGHVPFGKNSYMCLKWGTHSSTPKDGNL